VEDVAVNINPALANNAVVILDRYYYSNAAYQAATFDEAFMIIQKNRKENIPEPDRIYYFDLSPEEAMLRITKHRKNKECFDNSKILEEIAQRYNTILPNETVRIDARLEPEHITDLIVKDLINFRSL
jgi:dTMP kinase